MPHLSLKRVFILAILITQLQGRNFFVNSALEISNLQGALQPGDTLTMRRGLWQNQNITLHGNGTAAAQIYLRAAAPGAVRLLGNSRLHISGTWIVVEGLLFQNGATASGQAVVEFRSSWGKAQYCRLTNTAIVNYNPSDINIDYKWVSLYGRYNRVDHCRFENKTHSGTTLVIWLNDTGDRENYHRIDHNYFGYRPPLGFNGGETIRVGDSDNSLYNSNTLIEYNVFERCNGETEIISNKSCENIYRYNTFIECKGCLTLRHGNRCTVAGNFFFGNSVSETGGVRIIGEEHIVVNNYFQDLNGDGYSSALCIVKGVENSPLNRYFQVQRALVAFNTFVNCRNTFLLGYGTSSDQTLPPRDCGIANNAVQTNYTVVKIGDAQGTPVNFSYEGNLFWGSTLGIDNPGGISWQNPQLTLAPDSFYRPGQGSPVLNAAVGSYTFITTDIDGQPRSAPYDVGCDEQSEDPIINFPLSEKEVGCDWYQPGPYLMQVAAGENSLALALNLVAEEDTLELISDGGIYELNSPVSVNRRVQIRAAATLTQKPVIRRAYTTNGASQVFEMQGKGDLILKGVRLEGYSAPTTVVTTLIATSAVGFAANYRLHCEDCDFSQVRGNIFRAYPGTVADTLRFSRCTFNGCDSHALRLDEEAPNSGKFNVGYLEVNNCTFWNVGGAALSIFGGDEIPFTPGPYIKIEHCTFDASGTKDGVILDLEQVDLAMVANSLFSNTPAETTAVRLYGWSNIGYCAFYQTGTIGLIRGATAHHISEHLDPEYQSPATGDFTLSANSPVRQLGSDGLALGDLRWAANPVKINPSTPFTLPHTILIAGNYPNPFNSATRLYYEIGAQGVVQLEIFDLGGRMVARFQPYHAAPGYYVIDWEASHLPAGVYFCRLNFADTRRVWKMVLLK